MSGFIINLASLAAGASRIQARARANELGLAENDWAGWVEGALEVDKVAERVSVRGRLQATARLQCVRCLKEFDQALDADLEVFADRAGGARRLEQDLERDDYMKFHDGRQLDLREETRETLLLELPISPHCRETCQGLCPRCGADRNEGPCGCPG